jgi:hypothetical protein
MEKFNISTFGAIGKHEKNLFLVSLNRGLYGMQATLDFLEVF